jgi:predicted GNAT superfamily acetyltransferase
VTITLRDLQPGDLPRIVELNDAAYPAVPITSLEEMTALLDSAGYSFAAIDDNARVVGFVIGMMPGADYDGENYRFFEERGVDSLYLDRIVVDESLRGQRIGQQFYDAVFALARDQGRAEVTCEVNLDPPNPGSMRFHERLGFRRVGEQQTKGGTVTVALLAAPV